MQAEPDITVVKVEGEGRLWCVHFSEPVWHPTYQLGAKEFWHILKDEARDELAAFLWGLDVIKKYKERVGEHTD